MARLDHIVFSCINTKDEDYVERKTSLKSFTLREHTEKPILGIPQLYWSNGEPWNEANLWIHSKITDYFSGSIALSTIENNAACLYAYMVFLEDASISWKEFPELKADRCLVRFRGYLVGQRDKGKIASSTASVRMSTVLRFYRWVHKNRIYLVDSSKFEDKKVNLVKQDQFGFNRSMEKSTSKLSIPNRARSGNILEGGLFPVSIAERDRIIRLSKECASYELYLMLSLGFGTGMRLGSICDLKIKTIFDAIRLSELGKVLYLKIGPGVIGAPVHTKFGVHGSVIISESLHELLVNYATSVRRLLREAMADKDNKDLLFLNKYGRPYSRSVGGRSSVVNVEISRLRKKALARGVNMSNFKFHSSRATFATSVADQALSSGLPVAQSVALVRDLLLHKDDVTSLKYINFVQDKAVSEKWANEFTKLFLGV